MLTDMNPKYSASRFSTYESCLLKYKLAYIDDLSVDRTFDIQEKGLVFHSIAEHTEPGESYESIMSRAKDVIAKSDFDKEKYPVEKAIPVFYFCLLCVPEIQYPVIFSERCLHRGNFCSD